MDPIDRQPIPNADSPGEVAEKRSTRARSGWRVTGWICCSVITVSVAACLIIAASRSEGLTRVTVTALDRDAEPRDHKVPFFREKEALPDYDLTLVLTDRWPGNIRLGTKPDQFAADGLTWHVSKPVSVLDITSVRLTEKDKVISDAVAEVQITGRSVTEKGYRFDFETEVSAAVGVESFFGTPVGKAIAAGFGLAVLIALMILLAGIFG